MKKTFAILMAALMLVMSMAACSSGAASTGSSTASGNTSSNVIKIGATGPLTGGAAIYGLACQRAAQIAVDEINALGGLQFELRYEDDAHDAEKAVNAYNALKDWGVQITLGSVTTAPAKATSALNYEDGIFALTPSASGTTVVEGKDNVFQMCFTDPNQGMASARYIKNKNLASKIAIIYKNDEDYSMGIYQTFIAEAEKLGLDVVSTTTFTADSQNDFSVQLGDAQAAGADLLFLPMYYQPASLILAQANQMGYAPKFFGVDGMDGLLTMEGFDTALGEGVMLLTPFSPDASDEKTANFVKKYQELYGEVPNQFGADAYDCVYAIYQACSAGGVTPDMTAQQINDIMKAQFTSMKFDGVTGTSMTWETTGMVSKDPKGMVIENGTYVGMD